MRTLRLQIGLSMIELLVALAIGSFLVLGITQIYLDNRRSYAFQQGQGENLEGSRYAMLVLQQELSRAGYRRLSDNTMGQVFKADTTLTGCNFPAGKSVVWNNANSSLCIRYEPRTPTDRDCLGNTLADVPAQPDKPSPSMFRERIFFSGGSLMCASSTADGEAELMAGVADLRIELGLAASTDGQELDRYVAPAAVSDNILAIRYMLLMRSSGSKIRDTDDSPVLDQWQTLTGATDDDITALGDDRQIYQISQSTIMLRNLMP